MTPTQLPNRWSVSRVSPPNNPPPPQNVRAGGMTLEAIPVIGTTADFPDVRDYAVAEGRYFTADEDDRKAKVVVLGAGIATDLFGAESAIGQTVTVGSTKLTVIGVMESKGIVCRRGLRRAHLPADQHRLSKIHDRLPSAH